MRYAVISSLDGARAPDTVLDATMTRARSIAPASVADDDEAVPLYLVRWPGLVAALVSAADEDDLLDILDETANPEGCTWTVYRGPVCIEFSLKADVKIEQTDEPRERPLSSEQVQIGDVSSICEREGMEAIIPAFSDTAAEMVDAIMRKAFPHLYKVVDTLRETLPEDEVRAALRLELDALVRASWQHEQTKRRPDQDSRVAAMMGTSPRLVARWAEQAALAEERAREAPPPKTPTRPGGKRKPKKPSPTR